jgi:hypothetical protein
VTASEGLLCHFKKFYKPKLNVKNLNKFKNNRGRGTNISGILFEILRVRFKDISPLQYQPPLVNSIKIKGLLLHTSKIPYKF